MEQQEQQLMKLEGTVEHVIYENADSGYAVFEVDAGGTDVVVAGNVGGVDNGMSVTVYGHMVNHPSYGEQFRAETKGRRITVAFAHELRRRLNLEAFDRFLRPHPTSDGWLPAKQFDAILIAQNMPQALLAPPDSQCPPSC